MKELETIEKFKEFLNSGEEWQDIVVQGLSLISFSGQLLGCNFKGSVFLGCEVDEKVKSKIIETGGLYFPEIKGLPYQPYRGNLYTRDILYDNFDPASPQSYENTNDWKIFQHYITNGGENPTSILESLTQRLHDHSISDALNDFLGQLDDKNRVAAVMGGHRLRRDSVDYKKAAEISYHLARAGYLMVSGGGPGAMEATHLGVWLSGYEIEVLDKALSLFLDVPTYQDKRWLSSAYKVIQEFPFKPYEKGQGESIGIPTWLYGHEPTTPFASKIAKYFANSVREEGLLAIAKGGVIYAPGNAGTIQEIFQDTCQNHYKSYKFASPMIFLNEGYWKWIKPVYPLLTQLAAGNDYAVLISCSDNVADIVNSIKNFKPDDANQ